MRQVIVLLSGLAIAGVLSGCGPEPLSTEEEQRENDAAIEAVEAAQEIPPQPIMPEGMAYADFDQQNLSGAGCAFSPADGRARNVFVTMGGMGYLKIDGEFQRLAGDMGSGELPMGARTRYDGKRNSVEFAIEQGEGTQFGIETLEYPAFLTIRNAGGQSVYAQPGTAECGA